MEHELLAAPGPRTVRGGLGLPPKHGQARRLVGNLLLKPIPLSAGEPSGRPNDVEIGWHLHPDAWGHGYATAAAQAVLDDAFSQGLTKVLAVTDPDNHASQAVCRRLGMTHLGRTTRYYDTPNELFEKLPG